MPIFDSDARPFEPEGKLLEVAIDRKVQPLPFGILHPPLLGARGSEARKVREQERAARLQHPRHLSNGCSEIGDVDQRDIAHDEIEASIPEVELFGAPEPVVAGPITPTREVEQLRGRIDPRAVTPACLSIRQKRPSPQPTSSARLN